MDVELLITTNGFKGTWLAVEYGAWLAESLKMKITLLGVTEIVNPAAIDDQHPLGEIFERAVNLFEDKKLTYRLEIRNGESEQVIPEKSNGGKYITVASPLGRPRLRRMLTGRSIRPLMEKIREPILYVPEIRFPLKKVLISAGGLGYEAAAENLALQIAAVNQAEVTILRVVPPTELDYPTTRVYAATSPIWQIPTPFPGAACAMLLRWPRKQDFDAKVIGRQGIVVEEIVDEVQEETMTWSAWALRTAPIPCGNIMPPMSRLRSADVVRCPLLIARYRPC